jgi:predicted metal-dependent hydrolase
VSSLPSPQLHLFPRAPSREAALPARSRASESSNRLATVLREEEVPIADNFHQDAARDLQSHVSVATREELWARAEALAFQLSAELRIPVRLAVTDNRSTMVSFRRSANVLQLRLHHMFLDAPESVVRAVADYAGRGNRLAGGVLDDYIRGQQPRIRQERHEDEADLEPRGRYFHLQALFDQLNHAFFEDTIQARIGWGRMPPRRRRKSIRLGVYDHQTREIRIHPALDRPEVPTYFVEFIIFHEMLHQLFPSSNGNGRRVHHPRAFREREKAFPLYAAALRWERENLNLLLRG